MTAGEIALIVTAIAGFGTAIAALWKARSEGAGGATSAALSSLRDALVRVDGENASLRTEVEELRTEVKQLRSKVARYERERR